MGLVDAHCHFDFAEFDGRRDRILSDLQSRGIERLVIPGVRWAHWDRVADVARAHKNIYYCLGIHPWYVDEHDDQALSQLRQRLEDQPEGCVALGECGLDRIHGELDRQQPWFEAQVELARDLDWPLVIHSVRTHDEVLVTLKRVGPRAPVLVHGFSGSKEQASKLVDQGCYLGVGGVITHERASKTRTAIAQMPLEALVLETDAPDMPPAGVAKGDNSPVNLERVLAALCELRTESEARIREALAANVRALYRWTDEA
ncbi:MAG: TatD family hydrolase [Marinobacter sp.]|uniref:TatD family hydrolase n=1 Tax=Marinobacter sp. TaxID=50741 RepID=UPI00299F4F68|nr:TatD family hydrolase [Marinobacter sp.]MDX1757929.1 TatD family hydrolase [Marinobacter sp.]